MIVKSHFINCPKEMFPHTKRRNMFSGTSGKHKDQSTFIHRLRPPRFVSRFFEKDICTQDLHIEMKTLVCLDPAGNPLPVKAKARLVIHGQYCPDNAQGLVRTSAPKVHRTAVSFNWFHQWDGVGVSGCGFFLCLSARKTLEVEEPLFFHVDCLESRQEL